MGHTACTSTGLQTRQQDQCKVCLGHDLGLLRALWDGIL